MRLWSLHPKYLDAQGLVALWREALLAQAVLGGLTGGYNRHPQLIRFRNASVPSDSIACYLQAVHAESVRRGYRFDKSKIHPFAPVEPISVTGGQLDYEWTHLRAKLQVRAPSWLAGLDVPSPPETHPLFHVIPGPVAEWEVGRSRQGRREKR